MGDLSPNFDRSEFQCHHFGVPQPCPIVDRKPSEKLIEALEVMRKLLKRPLVINSGWRCEPANRFAGGVAGSAHLTGEAADIRATTSTERWELVTAALKAGITRIGIDGRFTHIDVSTDHPQQVIWLYGAERS